MSKPTAEETLRSKLMEFDDSVENNLSGILEAMEEHANNKAEELAIGFAQWFWRGGREFQKEVMYNQKSMKEKFQEYKQSLTSSTPK